MKKFFFAKSVLLCVALIFSTQADAQLNLGNLLKNVVSGQKEKTETETSTNKSDNGGILSALTNVFSNSKVATKDKIIGTWVYEEPAIVMSSDNSLKNIGGKIAASTIENKLKDKLEKYGLKQGCITMTFDKSGNFTQTVIGKKLSGTYTIEDEKISLKYGGKVNQILGTTQLDGNNLLIVMDATKLLEYVNMLGSILQNSALKTATSLLGSMDGLECGLKLVKQ